MEEGKDESINISNHMGEGETPHLIAGEVMISPEEEPIESDHINDEVPSNESAPVQFVGQISEEDGDDQGSPVTGSAHEYVNDEDSNGLAEVFSPPVQDAGVTEGEVSKEIYSPSHDQQSLSSKPHDWNDEGENMPEDDEEEATEQEEMRGRTEQTRIMFTSQEVEHLRHRIAAASYRMGKTDVAGLFDRIDRNKSGQVELEELSTHLRRLMPTVSKKQISQLFRYIDKNQRHSLSKNEFVAFIEQRQCESPRKRGIKGGQSPGGEVRAEGAMSGNKPKTSASGKRPSRDPSRSSLMIPTKARINDLANFMKNKAEIKDEDDPWWEKRAGKMDGIKNKSKQRYAYVESKLYQTTHSYEAYKTAPTRTPRSPYQTSSPSSSGGILPSSPNGSTGRMSTQTTPTASKTVHEQVSPLSPSHRMPPGEAEMLRHKFLAASYTPQGPDIGKLFTRMDLKKNGVIDLTELIIAVRKVIPDVRDQVVAQLMEEIDFNKQGHIGLKELEEFINQRHSIQISPEHQRSGVHRTATKAASDLRFQRQVNNNTFAKKNEVKRQQQQLETQPDQEFEQPKQPIYSIDYEAVMDHHYDVGLEYDRRQELIERAESIISNKPSQSLINCSTSSIHVVESEIMQHQQREDDVQDRLEKIQFIQYLVDEHDQVWILHNIQVEPFENAFEELYHEGLNDFKDRNNVPLVDKRPLAKKRQAAGEEYDRRDEFLNEAMAHQKLPVSNASSDVDDMEVNEYSSSHLIHFKSNNDNNQSEVVHKYIVFPDDIVYFHSAIPAGSITLEDVKNAKEIYLQKQCRVYCESSASLIVEQIDEQLNNANNTASVKGGYIGDVIAGLDNDDDNNISNNNGGLSKEEDVGGSIMKSGTGDYVRDHSNCDGSDAESKRSNSGREGYHKEPGFLQPTKNSTAGKYRK